MKVTVTVFVLLACCASQLQPSFAASRTAAPDKPIVKSISAKGKTVTIKWKKAKNAKAYNVYVIRGRIKWKYLKKVKKTAANKRKYSNTMKYRLKVKGSKYYVYKQYRKYTRIKSLKANTKKKTFSCNYHGGYEETYTFVIKAANGKKVSYSKRISAATGKEPDEKAPAENRIISAIIGPGKKLVITADVETAASDALSIGLSPAYAEAPTHFMEIAESERVEGTDWQRTMVTTESLNMEDLYEKIYLLRNGEIVGTEFYVQNPEEFAEVTAAYPQAVSKKGLKISWKKADLEAAKSLKAGHVLLDVNLAQFIQKGGYDYKGYSFNRDAIQARKDLIRKYNEAGIQVTVVVVLGKNGKDLIYPEALSGSRLSAAHFVAFNTKEGREKVQALLEVLAYEWCTDDAFVSNWICGNEINNRYDWNYAGDLSWEAYIAVTSDMYRMFNTAVRGTIRNTRTYLCFERKWNGSERDADAKVIGARGMLDYISAYLEKEGGIHFDVALHPYADNLFYPNWWDDDTASDPAAASSASMKNIREIAGYLNDNYGSRVILSEQGFTGEYPDGTDCQEVQAAAVMAAYYMAAFDDNIDLFGYHRLRDHPNEISNKGPLPIGLFRLKEEALKSYYEAADGKEKADAASKIFMDPANYEERLAAEVFRNMDTAEYVKADYLARYYDQGLTHWEEFPGFDKSKLR